MKEQIRNHSREIETIFKEPEVRTKKFIWNNFLDWCNRRYKDEKK